MKPTRLVILPSAGLVLVTLLTASVTAAENYSHARIVRLSFVEGTVTVQRPDLTEWAEAPVNTPIQEGFKVSTAENSFVEVEFENASTARLGQLSLLEFNQLALMPSGAKVNRLTLHQGYATFNVIPERDDVNEVKTGETTLTLAGGSRTMYRLDLDEGVARVEVFKGSLEVSSPQGSEILTKDMVVELRPGTEQAFMVSQGITKDAWDEWVEQRENQPALAPSNRGPGFYSAGVQSSFYGWNDLSLYGSWLNFPGYGYGWAPLAPYGWAPYSLGRWCWYPTFGYTWISAEPWGWLPYHYGDWIYVPGAGWSWFPDSFGLWSPALVTWYQGPGWIAWAPQPPRGGRGIAAGAGQTNCGQDHVCTTAVALDAFQNGRPINRGNILPVNLSGGRLVASPQVPPTRLAMLPGSPVPPAATQGMQNPKGANAVLVGPRPSVRAPSSRSLNDVGVKGGAVNAESGIAFDPERRRYVNSQGAGAGTGINASSESPSGVSDASSQGKPAEPMPPSALDNKGAGERQGTLTPSSPLSPPPASSGTDSGRTPRVAPSSGSRGDSAPGRHWFHHSSPSSDRAAPSSSGRQNGGGSVSRSSSSSGSGSFGGGRSGGGGSSGSSGGSSHSGGSRH